MNRKTYLAIGHISRDIGSAANEPSRAGGSVCFSAATAAALGWSARIVTQAEPGPDPCGLSTGFGTLSVSNVELENAGARRTTTFVQRFADGGRRTQYLRALAPSISPEHVPQDWRNPDVLHLAPIAGEIGADCIFGLRAGFLGITAQGWMRDLKVGERVGSAGWHVPDSVLEKASAVVFSEEDHPDSLGLAARLAGRVPVVVVTLGQRGAIGWGGGGRERVPARAADSVDPTGAGDVFAAALFIALFEGSGLKRSMAFATAAAAFAVEKVGVGAPPDRESVLRRMETAKER